MARLAWICAVLASATLLSSSAHAGAGSVSLLGVSGVGGERFASSLEQDIAELYELVPGEVYRRTAEQIDKRGASPEEVRMVCTALRIDALVAGSVAGQGKQRQLVLVVREGVSGEVIARKRYDLSGRTLPLMREQVMRDLVRAFEHVRRIPKRGQPQLAVTPPTMSDDEPEPSAADENEPTTAITRSAPPAEHANRGFFAGAGPALMTRSLAFDAGAAPGYRGGTVTAIRVEGGVFPAALSAELAEAHPVIASFGLLGSYERAFGFTSSNAGSSATGSASRWSVVFVGRAPLGHNARGGTLSIETGLQRVSWGSTSATATGVPDVAYLLVDAGLGWDREVGTRYLALSVRLAAQSMVDAGAITAASQYGSATGWGLDVEAGLSARPTRWLWIRLGARYTPLFLSFGANGARLAHAATDQFVDGTLEVGFAL